MIALRPACSLGESLARSKSRVLKVEALMRRNAPTEKGLVVTDDRDLSTGK
jgi:hypothetical protein